MYSSYKNKSFAEDEIALTSISAIDLAQEAARMHEIACGFSSETGGLCVDELRLEMLSWLLTNEDVDGDIYNYYRSRFGNSKITFSKIYPLTKTYELYLNKPTTAIKEEIPLRMPIYLYNATTKTNSFGVITVVRYR